MWAVCTVIMVDDIYFLYTFTQHSDNFQWYNYKSVTRLYQILFEACLFAVWLYLQSIKRKLQARERYKIDCLSEHIAYILSLMDDFAIAQNRFQSVYHKVWHICNILKPEVKINESQSDFLVENFSVP